MVRPNRKFIFLNSDDNEMRSTVIKTKKVISTIQCLPPANEVWGKIMFLHLCEILFVRAVGFPACTTGHMTRGSASRGIGIGGVGQTPTGLPMGNWADPQHYRIWSTIRQYASYWNAFLFYMRMERAYRSVAPSLASITI